MTTTEATPVEVALSDAIDPVLEETLIFAALTDQQKNFLKIWWQDKKRHGAKAYRAAYPKVKSEEAARSGASRTLTLPAVRAAICALRANDRRKHGLDTPWWVEKMLEDLGRAEEDGDMATAAKFLSDLGKHLGVFEKDNKQKAGTDTPEAIRERLIGYGFPIEALEKARAN